MPGLKAAGRLVSVLSPFHQQTHSCQLTQNRFWQLIFVKEEMKQN